MVASILAGIRHPGNSAARRAVKSPRAGWSGAPAVNEQPSRRKSHLRLLKVEGVSPLEGGMPIVVNGQIVGAIGVSGVTSQQDAQIGQAGADALK